VPHALPSAAACPALGKARHSANALFAERNTRQNARQLPAYPAHAVTIFKKMFTERLI